LFEYISIFIPWHSFMPIRPHNKRYFTMTPHISIKCTFILFLWYTFYDFVADFDFMLCLFSVIYIFFWMTVFTVLQKNLCIILYDTLFLPNKLLLSA
jgi:hypothetical protein